MRQAHAGVAMGSSACVSGLFWDWLLASAPWGHFQPLATWRLAGTFPRFHRDPYFQPLAAWRLAGTFPRFHRDPWPKLA